MSEGSTETFRSFNFNERKCGLIHGLSKRDAQPHSCH